MKTEKQIKEMIGSEKMRLEHTNQRIAEIFKQAMQATSAASARNTLEESARLEESKKEIYSRLSVLEWVLAEN